MQSCLGFKGRLETLGKANMSRGGTGASEHGWREEVEVARTCDGEVVPFRDVLPNRRASSVCNLESSEMALCKVLRGPAS